MCIILMLYSIAERVRNLQVVCRILCSALTRVIFTAPLVSFGAWMSEGRTSTNRVNTIQLVLSTRVRKQRHHITCPCEELLIKFWNLRLWQTPDHTEFVHLKSWDGSWPVCKLVACDGPVSLGVSWLELTVATMSILIDQCKCRH